MMLFVRRALYRGWWSLIVSISVNNFAYFYAFHYLRVFVVSSDGDLSIHQDFLSGLIAGQNVVQFCLYPFCAMIRPLSRHHNRCHWIFSSASRHHQKSLWLSQLSRYYILHTFAQPPEKYQTCWILRISITRTNCWTTCAVPWCLMSFWNALRC